MSGHFDEEIQAELTPWVCPHCNGHGPHFSDDHGCEQHGDPEHDSRVCIGPTDI